ncbi:MAG: histidine--tRNA ligase [Thermoplasmata archaeon]|nr:histidine--tRNA ligase [Thermoplasmata archaeon]
MSIESLRGFRDYLPPDAGARSEIRRRLRAAARRSGFQELETPSVESLELFAKKSGEEIESELWTFVDKGQRPVTLIAESTPALARIYAQRASAEALPVKWFSVARVWRYEEPQAGRTREFTQFNLDILGAPGVEAEVEVLSTAAALLDEAGAKGLYAFRINDRRLIEGLGDAFGVRDRPGFLRALDRRAKSTADAFRDELRTSGLDSEAVRRLEELFERVGPGVPLGEAASFWSALEAWNLSEATRAAIASLRRLSELLGAVGIADRVVLDPGIVRGLAYYTSTVFEAYDRTGDGRALFGGGRYDGLIELFGGPATPACGLAIGDQTLEILLRSHGRWPEGEPALDTYVVAISANELPLALSWVARLRAAGLAADCDVMGRSLTKQLKEASRRKARRAILLGPREVARGVVLERDLVTGDQRELPASGPPSPV